MITEDSNLIIDVSLDVNVTIILHEKGRESWFEPDDITDVREKDGKTIVTWSYNNGEYEMNTAVDETVEEVKTLIKKANDSEHDAYEKYEIVETNKE